MLSFKNLHVTTFHINVPLIIRVIHAVTNEKNNIIQCCNLLEDLRIPDSYDAKIAKICYLWTLLPAIRLKDHIFETQQKSFLSDFEKIVY